MNSSYIRKPNTVTPQQHLYETTTSDTEKDVTLIQEDPSCSICYDPLSPQDKSRNRFACGHDTFHKACISKYENLNEEICCPLCQSEELPPGLTCMTRTQLQDAKRHIKEDDIYGFLQTITGLYIPLQERIEMIGEAILLEDMMMFQQLAKMERTLPKHLERLKIIIQYYSLLFFMVHDM
jgi:hypothetical protein